MLQRWLVVIIGLPLLLAALLVIWGLWYARPIGVDTCLLYTSPSPRD